MNERIKNIIDLEDITQFRKTANAGELSNIKKGSIVKLVPLEYLKHGVKVLINGKLFIAVIEGDIPMKEEIAAIINNTRPFSLSLNVMQLSKVNTEKLAVMIINTLELPNSESMRYAVKNTLEENKTLIKSKLLLLNDLGESLGVKGIEYSLLVNLLWNYKESNKELIKDLYNDLFEEPFESICNNLYRAIEQLLFLDIQSDTLKFIKKKFVYNPSELEPSTLLNKSNEVFKAIKMLNNEQVNSNSNVINSFILNGSKYIFQKSLFKEYDYYPDFVIIERNLELEIINYKVKKLYNKNGQISYKINFHDRNLPFELKGYLRNNFLASKINTDQMIYETQEIDDFSERLKRNWNITSEINSTSRELNMNTNLDVNKLVS